MWSVRSIIVCCGKSLFLGWVIVSRIRSCLGSLFRFWGTVLSVCALGFSSLLTHRVFLGPTCFERHGFGPGLVLVGKKPIVGFPSEIRAVFASGTR